MPTQSPHEIINQLTMDAGRIKDKETKQDMLEAAETMTYLLTLLEMCDEYIRANAEEGNPRFLRAVTEALKKS